MNRLFKAGFVVGKFAPLHLGHCHLIETAQKQCEQLYILSYSEPEFAGCEPERRLHWLNQKFPTAKIVVLGSQGLPPALRARGWTNLPKNDTNPEVHRRLCAEVCMHVFGEAVDAVFSSESYGEPLAEAMSQLFSQALNKAHRVQHCAVDNGRLKIPISATEIRSDLHHNRRWLPPEVYADFVQRICLLGAESTGKSTLSQLAAQRLETVYVPEYGRTLWDMQGGKLEFADLLKIAETQTRQEEAQAKSANQFLICDTSPLTTLFYSEAMFQRIDPRLRQLSKRSYHHTFLCAPDFPLVQDGTRQDEAFRQTQHEWYLRELKDREIAYQLLTGSLEQRLETICQLS